VVNTPISMRSLLCLLFSSALLLTAPQLAQAQGSGTVNGISLPGATDPYYVIAADALDGDGTTNRHRISTRANVTITTAGSYSVEFTLLDPDNNVMATNTTIMGLIPAVPDTRVVDGHVEPSAANPLLPGVLYRLRARLKDSTAATVDGMTGTPGRKYVHFTGTDSSSQDRNAVAEVTSVTIDREWLLETDATKTSVPVTVNYLVHRYDRWHLATPNSVNLDVSFGATLTNDASNAPQAVMVTGATSSVPIDSHDGGSTPGPVTVTPPPVTFFVDPDVILKPQMHHLDVQISHVDNPDLGTVITGGSAASASTFLPHFTGKLTFGFGSIVTHFGHIASAPTSIPSIPPSGVIRAVMRIAPDNNSGTVDGITDYHYGDGTVINVILDESGDASYTGDWNTGFTTYTSGTVLLSPDTPAAEFGVHHGVSFRRVGDITLDTTGAHGDLLARLPTGVGWNGNRSDGLLSDQVDFGTTNFTQTLAPLPAVISKAYAPNSFYLCEETKPVYIESTVLDWHTGLGEFRAAASCQAHSIRKPLLDFMASYAYADPALAWKRSNDHVYNAVTTAAQPKFKTGTSGGGEMSTILAVAAASFVTHLPYDTTVSYSVASQISVKDDLIDTTTATTSSLAGAGTVGVSYNQHCQEALEQGCGAALSKVITLTSSTGALEFTADGGLHAAGSVSMTLLSWGAIPKPTVTSTQEFAHRVADHFTTGNFLMAGTFLRGDLNAAADEDGASLLLLSGFDPANLATAERPGTAAYTAGLGDYAGVNFRCTAGAFDGESTIQGDPYTPYTLTARSKYYARTSGVTGIHEAEDGTFPATAIVAGYDFSFDSFGFSFLSTEQEDSRTSGMLDMPMPTDFTLEFSEMHLSCIGALESIEISGAGTVTKEFNFWNCLFTPYTATFESASDCQPGDGTTLVLGFGAYASHIAERIVGALGIHTDGEFVSPAMISLHALSEDVPTRIALPAALKLQNADAAESDFDFYEFFPSQGAYLSASSTGAGFWSLFGGLDVPFFRDMQVHLHLGCGFFDSTPGTEPAPEYSSSIHMMGGWPSNGWLEGTKDPFWIAVFDQNNAGYTGASLAEYRDYGTVDPMMPEKYRPRAQQEWLDIISFDYPVEWSNLAFNFTGLAPITKDVVVVNTQHELVYMDSENAEITFGVRYEGLPEISVTNFVFNAVDDATGVSSAFAQAAGDKVFGALENGVDEFADALSDRAEDLLGTALDAVMTPVLNAMIGELKTTINTPGYTDADLELVITNYISSITSGNTSLKEALEGVSYASTFLADLDARLARVEQGIDSVISTVTIDPETGVALPVEEVANGLLKKVEVSGEFRRVVFEQLSGALVDVLSDLVDASTIEEELAALIQEQEPTLEAVTEALTEIRDLVTALRTQITNSSGPLDMAAEIEDILSSPSAVSQIASLSASIELRMKDIVLSASTQDLARLDAVAAEWQEEIAQEIRDAFYATTMVAEVQEAVKERLYDLQAGFNEAVDSAFAALNDAIREALSDVLAGLDTAIADTIGDFGTKLGAGSLNGFAHINGDSLDELRIDGEFELSVPDALKLNAYLQIKELDSDGPKGCSSDVGELAVEVTIGTTDMALGWTGLAAEGVRADMNVKFGLTGGEPSSMGGAFEMTHGEIGFETFEIYKLAASVMFGADENYIAAAIGVRFGEFDVAGGVFFGHSCNTDPLLLIDPLVSEVIPGGTITGIYAYGEGKFPIFGGTCFFNISAKAGAGVFYFQEGPTYGGRMTLGVYGEGLCAVEIGAEVSLAGAKSGNTYNFVGNGRIFGQAGKCPLCIKASFQVDFKYTAAGGWDVKF
jgi:hypothetical protein